MIFLVQPSQSGLEHFITPPKNPVPFSGHALLPLNSLTFLKRIKTPRVK